MSTRSAGTNEGVVLKKVSLVHELGYYYREEPIDAIFVQLSGTTSLYRLLRYRPVTRRRRKRYMLRQSKARSHVILFHSIDTNTSQRSNIAALHRYTRSDPVLIPTAEDARTELHCYFSDALVASFVVSSASVSPAHSQDSPRNSANIRLQSPHETDRLDLDDRM